jgi:hypothetical protein
VPFGIATHEQVFYEVKSEGSIAHQKQRDEGDYLHGLCLCLRRRAILKLGLLLHQSLFRDLRNGRKSPNMSLWAQGVSVKTSLLLGHHYRVECLAIMGNESIL